MFIFNILRVYVCARNVYVYKKDFKNLCRKKKFLKLINVTSPMVAVMNLTNKREQKVGRVGLLKSAHIYTFRCDCVFREIYL